MSEKGPMCVYIGIHVLMKYYALIQQNKAWTKILPNMYIVHTKNYGRIKIVEEIENQV